MAPLTDPRAQVLANCRILYGEAPIEILTLFTREFEDPIYQAAVMRYNETDGSWMKMLHKTFRGNNLVDLMYSLLYETEVELARRFSALGIALPLTGDEITVNFTREEHRGSVASIVSCGSRSSSQSATSTFEFIPTPRSGSPEPEGPDNAATEADADSDAEAEAVVDDAVAELIDPGHDDEVWIDTDEELQHDGEPVEEPTVVIERLDEGLVETVKTVLIEEVPVEKMAYEETVKASPQPEPVSESESLPQLESLSGPMPEVPPVPESVPEPKPLPEAEVVIAHDTEYTSTAAPQSCAPHESFSSTTRRPSQKNVTFDDIVFQGNHIGKGKARETSSIEAYTRYPGDWLEWKRSKDKNQVPGLSSATFTFTEDELDEPEPTHADDGINWSRWGSPKKYRKKQLQVVTEKEVVLEPEPEPPVGDDPWAIWAQSSSSKKNKKKKKSMVLESAAISSEPKTVSTTGEFDWGSWGTTTVKAKSKIPIRKEMSLDHGSSSRTEENDFFNFALDKSKSKCTSGVREEMSPEIGSSCRTENGNKSPDIGSSTRTENGDFGNFASDNGEQTSHQPFDSNKFHQVAYQTAVPEPDEWDTLFKRDKKGKSRVKTHATNLGQCSATVTDFNWDFTKNTQSTTKHDNHIVVARPSPQHLHHENPFDVVPSPSNQPLESHHPQQSVTARNEIKNPQDNEGSQDWLYGFKTPGNKAADGDTWPSIIPMVRSVVRDDGIDDNWGSFVPKKSKKGKKKASVIEWDD